MSSPSQPVISHSDLRAILADFRNFQISNWNQNDRDTKGSGICMGMCLDWLRRIYSTARTAKSKFGQPGRSAMYNEDEEVPGWKIWKNKKTDTRFAKQIVAQETYMKSARLNLLNMADSVIMPDLEIRLLADTRIHFSKSATDLPSLEDSSMQSAFGTDLLGAQSWMDQRRTVLFATLRIEKMPQLIASAHTGFKVQWELSNMKKKSNFNKVRYDDTSVPNMVMQQDAIDGGWIWKTYIEPNLSGMKDQASAILSSGNVEGGGHDVAFHCLAGTFYFYEPNFGEYHFQRSEDLQQMFCRLWDCIYAKKGYNWAFWANYISA